MLCLWITTVHVFATKEKQQQNITNKNEILTNLFIVRIVQKHYFGWMTFLDLLRIIFVIKTFKRKGDLIY